MPKASQHEAPEYLASKLSEIGRASFCSVCSAMRTDCIASDSHEQCPCQTLAFLFAVLSTDRVKLSAGTELDLRSLDSYRSALGKLTLSDLKKLETKVRGVIAQINQLKRTPLVRELNRRRVIPSGDVLSMPDFPCDSHFHGLFNLRKHAAWLLGDPRKPKKIDFNSDLAHVYLHIHSHSGRWHDERVADILNDLFQNRPEPFTQPSLKQWRYEHNLTDPK